MNYYYHKDSIHVSRVDLYVKNINKSLDFYLNNLGFSVLEQNIEYVSLTVDFKNELLRLYERQTLVTNNKMNIYHFALLLPTRKDLSKFLRHLITRQIPIDGAADHLVSEAIYLKDPDGIGIEIAFDKNDTDWEYEKDRVKMDTIPFDYKGVYYASDEDDIFGNLPVDTVIGHLHLHVDDLDKAKDFYSQILGFKITNDDIPKAVFLSDKNYHHHIAINSWYIKQNADNPYPQMKAFTIDYPSCEKYLKTLNNLDKYNITYKETKEGIFLKDSENTGIYLKI